MKKGILKKVGIVSLGLLAVVGIATGVTHCRKAVEPSQLIVNLNNSNDSILKINQRKNAIDNGNNSVTLEAELNSGTIAELDWSTTVMGSMGKDDGRRFISLDISEDTMSCTITLLDTFSDPISVSASIKGRPDVTAWCRLDCYYRYTIGSVGMLGLGDEIGYRADESSSYSYNYQLDYSTASEDEYLDFDIELFHNGTVESDYSIKYELRLSEAFIEVLNNNNISVKNASLQINDGDSFLQALDSMISNDRTSYYGLFKYVECPVEVVITVDSKLPGGSMIIHTCTTMIEICGINFDDYLNQSVSFNYENYIF